MSDPCGCQPNPSFFKLDPSERQPDLCLYIISKKTKNRKEGSVSHSTRIRLPLHADPCALNPNSYLLTLTQKHLKIQNVGSVSVSAESVLL
jgi:hypothetical protein